MIYAQDVYGLGMEIVIGGDARPMRVKSFPTWHCPNCGYGEAEYSQMADAVWFAKWEKWQCEEWERIFR